MKPEIGSEWRCPRPHGWAFKGGEVLTVLGRNGDEGYWHTSEPHGRLWSADKFFEDGTFIPLSPAPAEPAKAAGWKEGDRVACNGTVVRGGSDRLFIDVNLDGAPLAHWSMPLSALRPEAAPPAAAPKTLLVPIVGDVLPEDNRYLEMKLADARSKRDEYEALSVKRELELGDKEREIARLRSALRDATDRARKVGRL